MAGELGWTKSYMIKKFRENYGLTPMELDRRLSIDAAADLIISSNRTMEDIAVSLGYYESVAVEIAVIVVKEFKIIYFEKGYRQILAAAGEESSGVFQSIPYLPEVKKNGGKANR